MDTPVCLTLYRFPNYYFRLMTNQPVLCRRYGVRSRARINYFSVSEILVLFFYLSLSPSLSLSLFSLYQKYTRWLTVLSRASIYKQLCTTKKEGTPSPPPPPPPPCGRRRRHFNVEYLTNNL